MSGIRIWIPCTVECSRCGEVLEAPYGVDADAAARTRGFLRGAWIRRMRKAVAQEARDDGWIVGTTACYCPDCASLIEAGEAVPEAKEVSAAALVEEARLMLASRGARGKGGGR